MPRPPNRLASGTPPERTIDDGKFQLAPLTRYDYRVIAPREWSDKVMGKDWADLADLPWLATPPRLGASAAARRHLPPDWARCRSASPSPIRKRP